MEFYGRRIAGRRPNSLIYSDIRLLKVTGTLKKTYDAVICDYGNTLVWYYTRDQWPAIREECIAEVAAYLNSKGLFEGDAGSLAERVRSEERIDSGEHRVVPLEERLVRIFSLERAALEGDVPALHAADLRAGQTPRRCAPDAA